MGLVLRSLATFIAWCLTNSAKPETTSYVGPLFSCLSRGSTFALSVEPRFPERPARRVLRGRKLHLEAHRCRRALHGERRTRHQRQSVLPALCCRKRSLHAFSSITEAHASVAHGRTQSWTAGTWSSVLCLTPRASRSWIECTASRRLVETQSSASASHAQANWGCLDRVRGRCIEIK